MEEFLVEIMKPVECRPACELVQMTKEISCLHPLGLTGDVVLDRISRIGAHIHRTASCLLPLLQL